jgi:hypothetical protein
MNLSTHYAATAAFLTFLLIGALQANEVVYGNFTRDQGFNLVEVPVITLEEGELFEVISANARTPNTVINIKLKPEGMQSLMWQRWWVENDRATRLRNTMSDGTTSEPPSKVAVGPCQIVASTFLTTGPATGAYRISYKITRQASSTPATQNASSQVAVIPNDPNGEFEVILESSVDLVTWNVANPGTFGGDTPRRFFRTRIARRD